MIDAIAKIRAVELHAPTDRGLAMLALRPLSAAFAELKGSGRCWATGSWRCSS
jgi:hypothetical protein